ncbi:MAG TPA: hypothetical protein VGD05_07485 [Pyrinomonadaceae bacterium]|jgi:hypothetical protein
MEITESHPIALNSLPVGAKLLVQCKNDWRMAVVSANFEGKTILRICTAKGRTYRRSCAAETFIAYDGAIPLLGEGIWRNELIKYDFRW